MLESREGGEKEKKKEKKKSIGGGKTQFHGMDGHEGGTGGPCRPHLSHLGAIFSPERGHPSRHRRLRRHPKPFTPAGWGISEAQWHRRRVDPIEGRPPASLGRPCRPPLRVASARLLLRCP